jgi:hypothetical protein
MACTGFCTIGSCRKRQQARGMCAMHYRRWRTKGDPGPEHKLPTGPVPVEQRERCSRHGCERPQRYSNGLCQQCNNTRKRRQIVLMLVATFGGKCWHCGGAFPPEVFDFHHRDPSKKEFGLGRVVPTSPGFDRLMREAAKCDLLCANCHRKHHARERLAA